MPIELVTFFPGSNIKGGYGLIIMRNEQFSSMGFSPHLKNNLSVAANKGREKLMSFFSQGQSSLVLSQLMKKASPSYRLYHLMAWGLPLVMASLPLLKGYYGPAGAWW